MDNDTRYRFVYAGGIPYYFLRYSALVSGWIKTIDSGPGPADL